MTVMAEMVVWLFAAFGCSSLLVMLLDRWANRMSSGAKTPDEHYRLLVHNSEQVLERVVRRLLFRSYWSGRPIRISFQDEGSIDDTKLIVALYERYPYCWMEDTPEGSGKTTAITIDLRNEQAGA
jgi:hypothetical protein